MQITRILYHPITIAAITLVTLAFCISLYLNTREIRRSSTIISHLQTDLEKTSQDADVARQKYETTRQDFTKEKIAREELLLQKPGEYMVQVPDLPPVAEYQAPVEPVLTPWQEWQKLLF